MPGEIIAVATEPTNLETTGKTRLFLIKSHPLARYFRMTEVSLQDLPLKPGILIASINRGGQIILPRGKDVIREGDTVIVITTRKGLNDINDILQIK